MIEKYPDENNKIEIAAYYIGKPGIVPDIVKTMLKNYGFETTRAPELVKTPVVFAEFIGPGNPVQKLDALEDAVNKAKIDPKASAEAKIITDIERQGVQKIDR